MLNHLRHNYIFYFLFIVFLFLGYFDAKIQNQFLTGYYRLPYFILAVFTTFFCYTYCYKNAKLCATQSANYRKLALVTLGYTLYQIIAFFVKRDPGKGELTIYLIVLIATVIFYVKDDTRLKVVEGTPEHTQAFSYERKYTNWIIYPSLIVVFALQNIFYFYVDAGFQIYYNAFFQVAFGIAIANAAMIITKTRLDVVKLVFLVAETLFLICGFIYLIAILAIKFDLFAAQPLIKQNLIIEYAIIVFAISAINLIISFSKNWKGLIGFALKFSSLIFYLNFWLVAYRAVYY
ncbi:hypothetical protein [Psittacicella hinzii]|uniref:Uncharacterized protein n=1 Tax=Psittacicella hinzii TaxID=2028575 RepID=A0A3A1YL57_9GAMM|nr:hypothetical protein [Psittacicella hinzii]RIY37969.1 hypothetical protein CKF58_04365 [Psittacicella hinzii]